MIYTKGVKMTNINSVVTLVDFLLKESKYSEAEKIVNQELTQLHEPKKDLLELKQLIQHTKLYTY